MSDHDLEFFEQLAALKRQGRRFAVATVVSRRSPVSSHLGDHAVILADGQMNGFVGGSCSREIVRRQGMDSIAARSPRLVQIRPEGAPQGFIPSANHVVVPMSCASEGAVDVYIEPYEPPPLLLIAGFSPVAESLARLAQVLEWDCARLLSVEEAADLPPGGSEIVTLEGLDGYLAALAQMGRPLDAVVVASQGQYDELALTATLRAAPGYVGLLASRKRAATVREVVIEDGISAEAAASIHNPVGLNVGALTPGEVAVSIMAEIVQCRAALLSSTAPTTALAAPKPNDHRSNFPSGNLTDGQQDCSTTMPVGAAPKLNSMESHSPPGNGTPSLQESRHMESIGQGVAIDPVCEMEVEIAAARHKFEYAGVNYYFCCPACKRKFERNPAAYLPAPAVT